MSTRSWRKIVDAEAAKVGATVDEWGSGHLRISHPDGWVATVSKSPTGDWPAIVRQVIQRARNGTARLRWDKRGTR